jgi:Ca-activated chloride channel family protein
MILALTFGSTPLLSLLVLVPLAVAAYLFAQRRRPQFAVRFTNLDLLATVVPKRPGWRRHLPPLIYLLALATLLTAIARPTLVTTQQATVMLAIDVSGSMVAADVAPTRLAAAQKSARMFLDALPKSVKVGLVAFSTEARLLAPPTTDRQVVRTALSTLTAAGATAMGDAITVAVSAANPASDVAPTTTTTSTPPSTAGKGGAAATAAPTKIVVLLSDGKNTTGSDPLSSLSAAKQSGIPIDTIALGTPDGVANITDGRGLVQQVPVPPDEETLKSVAAQTGGKFFTAPSASELKSIYAGLGSNIGGVKHRHEITAWFAGLAIALLLLGGGLALAWFGRFP